MEPRRWRPKFYNPFTESVRRTKYKPLYCGFFRSLPLHVWGLTDICKILGYAAHRPSLFGFPDEPTCIVNTAYLIPSYRSLSRGVLAFGFERGCKNIIIPGSCSGGPFDALDVKLIEPLFRWNPGVKYLYLSQHCQPMAMHLVPHLAKCHQIQKITLEGWNDAVAIHRVVMACKRVDELETFSLDDLPRNWQNELSVQALVTLIEMHPKLRAVRSHRLFLGDWNVATQFSRCKHNVALVVFSCDYILLYYFFFLALLCVPGYAIYQIVYWCCKNRLSANYTQFWSVLAFLFTMILLVTTDALMRRSWGWGWVHLQKYVILARRRLEILRSSRQTALVKV
ncbi:unnamed protein product [Phytomonas sp. Hart1]|nr:unnamed protein product [Phytomonas sp. Hart1]|eukprot:CCW68739.1 unnamed protein product [Phytomonas sp. isolate Hart1]